MTTIEERMTILRTEFRTELKYLATKADVKDLGNRLSADIKGVENRLSANIKGVENRLTTGNKGLEGKLKELETRLMLRLGGLMVVGFGAVIAALRFWQ